MNKPDFHNLTLSDFYNMDILTRADGTKSPLIDTMVCEDGVERDIGLLGFNAPEDADDNTVRELGYSYYKMLVEELNSII